MIVPTYPLGATLGAQRTVAATTDIAAGLAADAPRGRLVLMGDSAGGGMALAVAEALRDRDTMPARIVLISPWLDIAVDQAEQAAIEPRDAMLAIPGLREAGRMYAGELDARDRR